MAMELLFENQTQLDEAVINHIIEKSYKKNKKTRSYHLLSLIIGIVVTAAAVYYGYTGIVYKNMTAIACTLILLAAAAYSFYLFMKNTTKNQIKTLQNSASSELLKPRKIKVYKNVIYQSAGKNHAEYRLHQFTGIEVWEHYFLLHYGNGYVIIDKNGFTTGTPEEFEKFMNARILKNC